MQGQGLGPASALPGEISGIGPTGLSKTKALYAQDASDGRHIDIHGLSK